MKTFLFPSFFLFFFPFGSSLVWCAGVVYHLSKAELEKWDADHAIELSESSHTISGRKLSIMTPSRNPNALSAKNSTNPETEIWLEENNLRLLRNTTKDMIDSLKY